MLALERLAEARIARAIEAGELDDLPGSGKALLLDDDRAVPQPLRAAYRILKNAGLVPPEVAMRHDMQALHSTIRALNGAMHADTSESDLRATAHEYAQARRRLDCLRAQYEVSRCADTGAGSGSVAWCDYEAALLKRLAR